MKPKIRFNNNCWQKHKVGDLCDLLTGYPFPGDKILKRGKNLLMRGINITEGIIRHSDEIDRYYNEDTIGLEKYRLQVGDLVIGMDGSKVGKNSALVTSKENNSLLVQRVARLRNEDKNLINLIQIAVGSDKFIKYVEEMKTSSAIPHISPADIRNFPLSLPEDSNERRFIASYFTSLDSQISASTSRLASLQQMKAASLQAMFPQEGETVPKIRFKGFEGEWKKVKFKDFGHVAMCKRIFKNQTTSEGDVPFYKIGTFGSEPDSYISQSLFEEYKKKYSFPNKGDILISAAGTIGRTVEYNGENCYYQDSNIVWLDHNNNITNGFLKQLYSIVKWSSLEGATIKRLYNSNILETTFYIPNINEQQAIASYFTSLDRQISLQSQRLEKLKQIKSACLDKMFV